MTTQRIDWIDYAKAIAIFCVILIHAHVPYPAKGIIRMWVIPLFFFLSGIFANTERYTSFKAFVTHKAKHIIVPYLCFNVITYLFWICIGSQYGPDIDNISSNWWKPLLGVIIGDADHLTHYTPLWFLPCLFTTECLYFLLFRPIHCKRYWWTVLALIFAIGGIIYNYIPIPLPWGFDIAFPMMVFYAIGAYCSKSIRSNQYDLLKIKNAPFLLLWSISTIVTTYILNPGEVKVFINEYGNYILFYIGAFAGIVFVIVFSRILVYFCGHVRWLSYIGRNTLIILCLHMLMFTIIKGITYYILGMSLEIYESPVVIIVGSIFNIILLCPFIFLINKYFPILIGKFPNENSH